MSMFLIVWLLVETKGECVCFCCSAHLHSHCHRCGACGLLPGGGLRSLDNSGSHVCMGVAPAIPCSLAEQALCLALATSIYYHHPCVGCHALGQNEAWPVQGWTYCLGSHQEAGWHPSGLGWRCAYTAKTPPPLPPPQGRKHMALNLQI